MKSINAPVTPKIEYHVCICTPWGGESFVLESEAEQGAYNADPDAWAAKKLDLTRAEYVEWVESLGVPLCAGKSRKGSPCKQRVGPIQMSAREWKEKHRVTLCYAHQRATIRTINRNSGAQR